MNAHFAQRMNVVKPSAIRDLLKYGADPSIISFAGGYPDASMFPVEELDQVFQSLIGTSGKESLQYTLSNGSVRLRTQIAKRMTADGVACDFEDVLILQGGQQGLDLIAKMLIDRGNVIITEDPTFLGALIAFNPYEPQYATVPMDQDGMIMEALEETLRTKPGVKFIYTVPDFQNPTGVTLSLERRKRMVELANQYDVYILEDSPYRELRYEGEPVAPIKSFDTEGRVMYLGSFSKVLAPGLRLGWVVASDRFMEQLGLLKLAADTQCSTLNMAAVSLYLETYDVELHIKKIQAEYKRRKNLMIKTIRESFPDSVTCTDPSGGMFTWISFPEGFDSAKFMLEHALPKAKVAYVPGATFFAGVQKTNYARVSFSTQSDKDIISGISSLGEMLKATL